MIGTEGLEIKGREGNVLKWTQARLYRVSGRTGFDHDGCFGSG